MELRKLIDEIKEGDVYAFTELARRFQEMAFGYAYSILGDFHLAQDATQEAFVAAYFDLHKLHEPDAFPGWLRGVVRHQCGRILRKRTFELVPLDRAAEVADRTPGPDEQVDKQATLDGVVKAINALPQAQREVVTLFYIKEFSQQEVAAFLDLPLTTVNNRLHAARKQLKRRMIPMVKDAFAEHGLPDDFARKLGRIVEVRGPIVDAQFAPDRLPAILSALTITDPETQAEVTVEVAQHLGNGIVRCVATALPPGLRHGLEVVNTGGPVQSALGKETIEQAFDLLGGPGAATARGRLQGGAEEILETGIKAIDLLCPFRKGGKVAVLGGMGVGKVVILEEVVHNVASKEQGVALFTFVRPGNETAFIHENIALAPTPGSVQTIVLAADDPFEPGVDSTAFDAVTFMTRERAKLQLWPAVDLLRSRSRLLDPAVVGQKHYDVAAGVRELLDRAHEIAWRHGGELSSEDQAVAARAERVSRFLTQYFFVAEPYTKQPGQYVSRERTVQDFAALLRGEGDDLPVDAFLYCGTLEEVREKAGAL